MAEYTHDELIAAFKSDLADEIGAITKYSAQIPHIDNPEMRRNLEEIRDDEATHAGIFAGMLDYMDVPYDEQATEAMITQAGPGVNSLIREEPFEQVRTKPQEADGTPEATEDYSEAAHWISSLGGGPGIVSDPGQARSQPCIRYELGEGHQPLVFQKGIIGPLDEEQVAEFCALGFEDTAPTERQKERFRALPQAAQECSQEVKDVSKNGHIDAFYSCLERELRAKGIQ
mgnify:CR=1 FL=1